MLTNIGIPGLLLVFVAMPSFISSFITGIIQFVSSPLTFLATYPIF